MKRWLLLLTVFGLVGPCAVAQSKGDRYNGVWTVSRGGGGMGRVFVDGDKLKGVLMDTGWLQMTGERRIGQLTGSVKSGKATVKVVWSSGAQIEFQGSGSVQRRGLSLDLQQVVNGRPKPETQFTLQAHRTGSALREPFGDMAKPRVDEITGEWSGSFVYGPNRGLAYVTMLGDGTCEVVMANEAPNDDTWNASGRLEQNLLELTVDSGFSKQAYKGKFRSVGPDQMQITFDRKNGAFVMTLSRW